ncbi:hypothetical protein [Desulfospira joergensenii]|uniref:hypothetical protein n=1 Tax=Desulfospira joergensenii TaxID=53329 RepID=UPI0003B5F2BC|nr:hypothetical protein [Desulfospira joergensenii]
MAVKLKYRKTGLGFGYLLWIFFFVLVLGVFPAGADFYQYRDSGGTIVITDDLSQVPETQRPGARSFEEIVEKKSGDHEKQNSSPSASSSGTAGESGAPDKVQNPEMETLKAWLNQEEKELNQEKEALLVLKETLKTPAGIEEYNARVQALNKKITAYQIELDRFNRKLKEIDNPE